MSDKQLRIESAITRRHFLNRALLTSGGLLTATSPADLVRALAAAKRFHLEETTIADVQVAFKSGATTATQLVQAYLERIEACDQKGPKLNVVIFLNPKAMQEAAALDERLRTTGKFVGPLHGVPVLLKDNINTSDMPTTGGSLSLAGYTPLTDATISQKLRAAGAIILAKVNLHEFAVWGETVSSILGQTLNPYDLTRTPGGSSGGTGAGLAANFAIAGIGTDTVNSIRSPASANCVVGIRPTLGLVSRAGVIPYSFTQDAVGPLARNVDDAVRMLNVLVGYDPKDPVTAWSIGNAENDYTKFLDPNGVRDKRIGVLRSFFGTAPIHEEVNKVVNKDLVELQGLGATVIELDTPDLNSSKISSDISVHVYEFKPALNSYLSSADAPVKSLDEIISSGKFHPNIGDNIKKSQRLELDDSYRLRLQKRAELQLRIMKIMADDRLDAIVYPHQQRLVVAIGETQVERNGALASVTGFPAIVVPGGFSSPTPTAALGVPVGIEFLGRPWSERVLIEIAYGYEQATKHRRPPPIPPPSITIGHRAAPD
ncbi:MAG TPA: amidase family protein [Candidatus Eremiobacteraceae bacterium]|nr:amidase family protein [Candidatus Eremiobacteraceae bacterium]